MTLRFFISLLYIVITISGFAKVKRLVVAQDGTGSFTTVQAAINAIDSNRKELLIIFLKKGVYREKIVVPAYISNVAFTGESREETVITNADYSGKFIYTDTTTHKEKYGTSTSYTMLVSGNGITLENLTIKNEAGRVGQAVALNVTGDRCTVKNCSIQGNQDTLLVNGEQSRQYYYNCEIEGTTDFIFGSATVLFDRCIIKSLTNSYITAASTTPKQSYGYVFDHCQLTATPEATSVYLGRPWRPHARVVYIACKMGKHIRPEGWHNWGKAENEATAFYAEYSNTGEGADTTKRVSWSHQLTADQANRYTLRKIFVEWRPK